MKHDYDLLPISILIFKNQEVLYANRYMKNIFDTNNIINLTNTFCEMLNIKSQSKLYDFLRSNTKFTYQDKKIKYDYTKGDQDIFIFYKLDIINIKPSVQDNYSLKPSSQDVEVLSYYKGIRLYSREKLIAIDDKSITILLSKKQQMNLFDNKEYFIKLNKDCYSSKLVSYNSQKQILVLHNIKKEKYSAFRRKETRLKIKTKKIYIPHIDKYMTLYDISKHSICFYSKSDYNFDKLLNRNFQIKLPFLHEFIFIKFLKKVEFNGMFKYIFRINHTPKKFLDFIVRAETELIKEGIDTVFKYNGKKNTLDKTT